MNMIFAPLFLSMNIVASGNCPNLDQIKDELARLLPKQLSSSSEGTVRVEPDTSGMRLSWIDSDGKVTFTRAIPGLGGCEARARAVAVVLAAYETDLSWAPLAPPPVGTLVMPDNKVRLGARTTAIDVGIGTATDRAGVGGIALMEAQVSSADRSFGFLTRVRLSLPRSTSIDEGHANWWRIAPSVGIFEGLQVLPFDFRIHQELALLVTSAHGEDFQRNQIAYSKAIAVAMGAKISWESPSKFRAWIDLSWMATLGRENLVALRSSSCHRSNSG
jgi:hypothetical protein